MEDVIFLKKLVSDLKITRDIASDKKMKRIDLSLPTDKQNNIIMALNVSIAFYEKLIKECEKQLLDIKYNKEN